MVEHNFLSKLLILVHLSCFQLFDVISKAVTNIPEPTFSIVSGYFFGRDSRNGMTEFKSINIVHLWLCITKLLSQW